MFHGTNIQRPQLKFDDHMDNSNNFFVHKLLEKPNALVPLQRRMFTLLVFSIYIIDAL